ncbi:transposase [Xanthomonas prunicola]|uniref:Transposase n=1 Tax=Xanthomonas prunicola TaxID=2053930 RepID=A0A9Q9J0M6_9XANT|nr:transposase [Xanthomonas prunicola]UXA50444.1 transposase [Xanthomonas prunicola]UXA58753.1 transposase [Xanthomonas prunicola]UXA60896.1 transposase [Xanthomonas prunicola]UXA66962.1 transposase [Xanthomonas prunicola]
MQKRQRFTAEFKREAVRLLKAGDRPAAVIARELDIPRNRLYKWATDLDAKGAGAFGGSGRPKANPDELAKLQRENERLRQENEILKSGGVLCAGATVKYAWIRDQRGYRVRWLCHALGVSLLRVVRSPSGAARAGECPAIAADRAVARTNPRGVWQRAPLARVASAR